MVSQIARHPVGAGAENPSAMQPGPNPFQFFDAKPETGGIASDRGDVDGTGRCAAIDTKRAMVNPWVPFRYRFEHADLISRPCAAA